MEENNNELENVESSETVEETVVASSDPDSNQLEGIAPVYEPSPEVELPKKEEPQEPVKKRNKKGLVIFIVSILLVIGVCAAIVILLGGKNESKKEDKKEETIKTPAKKLNSPYALAGNDFEEFDLQLLRIENKKENVVYSPLSIKYALAMLNEGTSGDSNEQIKALIGEYKAKKYVNSANMSIANAFYIKDTFTTSVKDEFKKILKDKYDAEIFTDPFTDPYNLNSWVKSKTLNLIDKLVDKYDSNLVFMIVNALGIDMEWENSFLPARPWTENPSKDKINISLSDGYSSTDFGWGATGTPISDQKKFEGAKTESSVLEVKASINNYDPFKIKGEENFKKQIKDYYDQCYKEHPEFKSETPVEEEVARKIKEYKDQLGMDYATTDFMLYTDSDVRVFAKDLKKYDGTTLQYVGFMPIKGELSDFVKNTKAEKLNGYIKNLKTLEKKNFKENYMTYISGTIPKFNYEYNLNLKGDLQELGVTDIFDASKAKLDKITSEKGIYIGEAKHKAKIEFTEYGIKAAAATELGGYGNASAGCDYVEKVPVEKIDITFNRPYLYIIRDKDSGEVWFTGTVYYPLEWLKDPSSDQYH